MIILISYSFSKPSTTMQVSRGRDSRSKSARAAFIDATEFTINYYIYILYSPRIRVTTRKSRTWGRGELSASIYYKVRVYNIISNLCIHVINVRGVEVSSSSQPTPLFSEISSVRTSISYSI